MIVAAVAEVSRIGDINDSLEEAKSSALVLNQRIERESIVTCFSVHVHRPTQADCAGVHVE